MKNKKKSFYFDDYAESELNHNNKSNIIKVSLNKVTFLALIFFSLIIIFGIVYYNLLSVKIIEPNTPVNVKASFISLSLIFSVKVIKS